MVSQYYHESQVPELGIGPAVAAAYAMTVSPSSEHVTAIILSDEQEEVLGPAMDGTHIRYHAPLWIPLSIRRWMFNTFTSKSYPNAIRILRSWTLNSPFAPKGGLRYDGLYRILSYKVFPTEGDEVTLTFDLARLGSATDCNEPGGAAILNAVQGGLQEQDLSQPSLSSVLKTPVSDMLDDWVDYQRFVQEKINILNRRYFIFKQTMGWLQTDLLSGITEVTVWTVDMDRATLEPGSHLPLPSRTTHQHQEFPSLPMLITQTTIFAAIKSPNIPYITAHSIIFPTWQTIQHQLPPAMVLLIVMAKAEQSLIKSALRFEADTSAKIEAIPSRLIGIDLIDLRPLRSAEITPDESRIELVTFKTMALPRSVSLLPVNSTSLLESILVFMQILLLQLGLLLRSGLLLLWTPLLEATAVLKGMIAVEHTTTFQT